MRECCVQATRYTVVPVLTSLAMPPYRRYMAAAVPILTLLLLVVDCSSSSADSQSSHGRIEKLEGPSTPSALAAAMTRGVNRITSADITVEDSADGEHLVAREVETFSRGVQTGFDVTETDANGTVQVRYVSGVTYAKLPGLAQRPWVVVSSGSSVPAIRQLASTFHQLETQSVAAQYAKLVKVASSVKRDGHDIIHGRSVVHDTVVVNARKALAGNPLGISEGRSEPGMVHLELWLDNQWRPVRVTVAEKRANVVIDASYDAGVTIVAPPSDQIQSS
jgi:hypothetical protein